MAIRNSILGSSSAILCSFAVLALAYGCALEPEPTEPTPSGGSAGTLGGAGRSTGGASATGGTSGSGGTGSGTGGSAPKGGSGNATGGTSTTGGTSSSGAGGTATTAGTGGTTGGVPGTSGAGGSGDTGGAPTTGGAGGSTGGMAPTAGTGGAAGSSTGGSGTGTGDYNPDFVEFVGKDCTVAEPMDVNNPKLPDLFENFDGTRMTKKSEWACRRAELKKAVEKYIHGAKPGRPDTVTGTVSATSISVHVEHMGKSIDFSVSVSMPGGAATGPRPIMIGLGGGSLDRAILTAEGVATGNYNNGAMASETSRSGLFTTIYGSTGASAQVGWAWGISRVIDVLVDEKAAGRNDIIDPTAVGVTGCSRLGKGAFTIGAFDERIALGVPQESGTGGVSAFRVVNTNPQGPNGKGAQTLDSAWTEAQGWFGTAFGTYRSKVNTIPVDTHSLVAMYAPRGLLVLDNSRIGELGATAQHAATAAGELVYEALGVEKNIEYHGGNPSDPHNHCTFYASQADPLRRAIRAFLTKTAPPDGRIAPAAVATADLTEWIDWEAPTLQ